MLSLSSASADMSISEEIRAYDAVSAAQDTVIGGALQIAASRLLGQQTQQSMGENEMYQGIENLSQARKERDAEWERNKEKHMAEFKASLEKKRSRRAKRTKAT